MNPICYFPNMGESTLIHPGMSRLSKLEGAQKSLLDEEIFLKQELTLFYVCCFWEIFQKIHWIFDFNKKKHHTVNIWYSRWKLSPVITKGNTCINGLLSCSYTELLTVEPGKTLPAPHSFPWAVRVLPKAPFPLSVLYSSLVRLIFLKIYRPLPM